MTEPTNSAATSVLHVALAAHDAGLSVIPIRDDGTKKPALPWKQYQTERADRQTVRAWFAPGRHRAIGVICGQVSGWLTMLEMEGWAYDAGYWQTFKDAAEDALGVVRWAEIVRYVELSPTGGPHIYFRCPDVEIGNLKLSRGGDGTVMMETRGEGGYSVIAPSEGHATGNAWRVATDGTLDDICDVTAGEMEAIFDAARSLDQTPAQSPRVEAVVPSPTASSGSETGETRRSPVSSSPANWMDDTIAEFNDSVGVLGILSWLPGWEYAATENYKGESVHRLHRAGSDNHHGAMIFDSGRVAFFSSNCPAWADAYDGSTPKTYDAFSVMMHVDKATNDTTARTVVARELRAQGFGPAPELPPAVPPSDEALQAPEETEPVEAPPAKSAIRWVEDALAQPPDEPELLVTGLLRRGEITVVGAPRAIGKTWASLNLATYCARGEGNMFGNEQFRTLGPARVLYLQGELGEWGSAVRWHLLGAGDVPPKMIAESFERIRIRTTERRVTTVEDGTTMSDTHIDAVVDWRLEQLIQQVSADVLIIDPWATFFAGNENSNDETEAAIIALTDIARRHNLAVWIVHHITNKGTRDASAEPEDMWRGASRLADAVSTRVTMLPYWTPAQMKELNIDRRTARGQIKVTVLERNGPPVEMIHSELRDLWWSPWDPPNVGRPSGLNAKDVVRALEVHGGRVASKRALGALLDGKGHAAIDRVVAQLEQLGVLAPFDGPRNSIGYELTGRGLPE